MYNYLPHILATSFILSACIIFILIKSSLAPYFADSPDIRKVHQQIVSRIGGLGIILTFLILQAAVVIFFKNKIPQLEANLFYTLLFVAGFLAVFGTLDDVLSLNYKTKFLCQFALAGTIVYGFDITCSNVLFQSTEYSLGLWGPIISVFWIVGIMNAFNIIDGIDGLAASVSIISLSTLAVLTNAQRDWATLTLCVMIIGITGGFLVHNLSHRNKTFLGDTGSLFLGAILGVLTINVTQSPTIDYSFLVPLLIVGYPIFDISVAMSRRFLKRSNNEQNLIKKRFIKMFQADNEHLHHRLVYWGLSHLQATFLLTMVAATMGSVAINISRVDVGWRIAIFAYLITCLFLILNRLNYLGQKNWLTFPRAKLVKPKLIGVIEPGEVFFHSLKSFDQNELEFLNIPLSISNQFKNQLSAIIVHNALCEYFDVCWQYALRISEINDCPVFVVADKKMLDGVKAKKEDYNSILFIEKPVIVPDLIQRLKSKLIQVKSEPSITQEDIAELVSASKREVNA